MPGATERAHIHRLPLDQVFMEAEVDADAPPLPDPASLPAADGDALDRAAELLRGAERPVVMAGTGLYWARGEGELRAFAEELEVPVFLNGLARGCVPADHRFFSRARGKGLKGADVALVIGVPMDFRLGFGGSFGDETELIVIGSARPEREHPRPVAAELYGSVAGRSTRCARGRPAGRTARAGRTAARGGEREASGRAGGPVRRPRAAPPDARLRRAGSGARPQRGRDRRRRRLRVVRRPDDRHLRAGVLDGPGAVRVPRRGPGAALAAKLAHPDRQVCLLLGDGAFGFAGMEFDTFVRHGVPVVGVMGNNGIWALEKHPMEFLYGYSVAADLQPELPLRPGGRRARRPRRAGGAA